MHRGLQSSLLLGLVLLPIASLAQAPPEIVFAVEVPAECVGGRSGTSLLVNEADWNCPTESSSVRLSTSSLVSGSVEGATLSGVVEATLEAGSGAGTANVVNPAMPVTIYVPSRLPYRVTVRANTSASSTGTAVSAAASVTLLFQLEEWRTLGSSGSQTDSYEATVPLTASGVRKVFPQWPDVPYYKLTQIRPAAKLIGGRPSSGGTAAVSINIRVDTAPPPSMTVVEPEPDWILEDGRVSDVTSLLRVGGRTVDAATADGETRLLIRAGGALPNRTYAISVEDENGNRPSQQRATVGDIGKPGQVGFAGALLAKADADGWLFGVYRVPSDFVRTNADLVSPFRTVRLKISLGGNEVAAQSLNLIRPPVVLVHGLWDTGEETWLHFGRLFRDPRFHPSLANYGRVIGPGMTLAIPDYGDRTKARGGALGFAFGADIVLARVRETLADFRTGHNPIGVATAVTQVDIVAHSMGGDVTRELPWRPGFYTKHNYQAGLVHKVITIGTPHLGSPLATSLLDPANACAAELFSFLGNHVYQYVVLSEPGHEGTYTGGVEDLKGDGRGGAMSTALNALRTAPPGRSPIPIATLAGAVSGDQLDGLDDHFNGAWLLRTVCGGVSPAASQMTAAGFPGLIGGPSDGIVPLSSALARRSRSQGDNTFAAAHSQGAVTLGFRNPHLLESDEVVTKVLTLLELPTRTSTWYGAIQP